MEAKDPPKGKRPPSSEVEMVNKNGTRVFVRRKRLTYVRNERKEIRNGCIRGKRGGRGFKGMKRGSIKGGRSHASIDTKKEKENFGLKDSRKKKKHL